MTTAAVQALPIESERTWSPASPEVRKLRAYIKRRGGYITPEEVVAWDDRHGRRLLEWDDRAGAREWRVHQARLLLTHVRALIDDMQVRFYINVPATEETGLEARTYIDARVISANDRLRVWVIDDRVRRMERLASELRMWKLSREERDRLLARIDAAWSQGGTDRDRN